MIKAVIFDLYETLVTQSGTTVPRGGALGDSLGLDGIAYRREWKQMRQQILRGQVTFQQALLEIGRRLEAAIPSELIERASKERIRANTEVFQKIDPEIVAVTRDLQQRGMRLATISNCMAEDAAPWPTCPLAAHFTAAVFSFAVGCVKPDRRIYLTAIEQLGVSAGDTLYIGDGGDDELAGAERAGLRTAQAGWYVERPLTITAPFLATHRDVLNLVLQ
jgi:HAD superfamily hydrolase (TIGR01509 family)